MLTRVAVRHTDEAHPNAHWFAFGVGSAQGYEDLVTGTVYQAEQVAEALMQRAKEQYPEEAGYEHRVETLHIASLDEDGNEEGAWHPVGKSQLPLAKTGQTVAAHELEAIQSQEANADVA